MSQRPSSSQASDISSFVGDLAPLYPSLEGFGQLDQPIAPPRARAASGSEPRPQRGRGPLGSGARGVNLSERQATTLAMALSSSFTLLTQERPEKIGSMPDSCGRLLHQKLNQVLNSVQFDTGLFTRLP